MHKIVIGYDGSESADRALDRAAELLDGEGDVVLVSAIHMLGGKGGGFDPIEKEDFERQLVKAKARLADAGIAATTVEGMGDPARVIAEQAKESGADLIVVGNNHKNILERLLFGSVSDGVAHRADCDVLVVP
jgi:nucleotide-binding universal stress UspA family protein